MQGEGLQAELPAANASGAQAGGISASCGWDLGCSRPGDVVTSFLPADLEGWDLSGLK